MNLPLDATPAASAAKKQISISLCGRIIFGVFLLFIYTVPCNGETKSQQVEIDFAKRPLASKHTAVEVEIKSPRDAVAKITGNVFSKKTRYTMPNIKLKAGTHSYRLTLSDLKPTQPYGLPTNPIYINSIQIASIEDDVPLTIVGVTYLPEDVKDEDEWFSLPSYQAPVKTIDGKVWTEGMSYSSAGRFFNSTYNGLLNEIVVGNWFRVDVSGPEGLSTYMQFDLGIDGLSATKNKLRGDTSWDLYADAENEKVESNWVMMKVMKSLNGGGSFNTYCGIMAPGFLLECDKPIKISSRDGAKLPIPTGYPDEGESRFFSARSGDQIPAIGPAGILTSEGLISRTSGSVNIKDLKEPWIVALWGIKKNTFHNDKAVGILFTFEKGDFVWDEKGITLPAGITGVSSAFHGLLPPEWDSELVAKRALQLTKMLRNYPVDCKEWYRVGSDRVVIRNEITYKRWGAHAWQSDDYAAIPPIINWAQDSLEWPQLSSLKTTGETIHTSYGPYRWIKGNELEYALPNFAIKSAAFPRLPEYRTYCKEMSDEFVENFDSNGQQKVNWNAFEVFYQQGASWMKAILGASLLEKGAREEIFQNASKNLDAAFNTRGWLHRQDPYSGLQYIVSGWADDTVIPIMFADGNSQFGLAGYGLYQYCKYSGDWDKARKWYPRLIDLMRYTEVCNDWAVPTTSARESARVSAIDMDVIGYLGLCGVERIAEMLGHEKDRMRAAYIRSKVALAAALRMNFNEYLHLDSERPEVYICGFSENGSTKIDSANNTSMAKDHLAMMFSWTGEQAEYFNFLMDALSPEFIEKYQGEFLDTYVPSWRQMDHEARPATHIAMRAWLPEWPREKLVNDYNEWMKFCKRKEPYPDARQGGMYGVYMNQKEKIYLINWEPARLGTLDYDPKEKSFQVEVTSAKSFVIRLHSPYTIKQISIDGHQSKITPKRVDENVYEFNIPGCEKMINIQFN